jgi:hypothetical protein
VTHLNSAVHHRHTSSFLFGDWKMLTIVQQQELQTIRANHEQSFLSLIADIRPCPEQLDDLREYKNKCDGKVRSKYIVLLNSPDFFDSDKVEPIKAEIRTYLDDIELFAEMGVLHRRALTTGGYHFFDLLHLSKEFNFFASSRPRSSHGTRLHFSPQLNYPNKESVF